MIGISYPVRAMMGFYFGAHLASYPMSTRGSYPGGKASGA